MWSCASCGEEDTWSAVEQQKKKKKCPFCGEMNYLVTVEIQLPMKDRGMFGEVVSLGESEIR